MLKIEIKTHKWPRKSDEYAVVITENGEQLTCLRPYTPYIAEAELTVCAFEALLATPEGEKIIRQKVSELP